jgi:hypothetical protein
MDTVLLLLQISPYFIPIIALVVGALYLKYYRR